MAAQKSSAAHAAVVVLKLRGFARKSVAEQAALKAKLDGAVGASLGALREDERIVLDTPGGAAVVVLANPGAALDFATNAARSADGADLAAGINHGPVRVVGAEPDPVIVGDGIAAADAIAELAPTGRLVAAREFRDALAHAAPERARHLARAGKLTDAHDRSHELFFADRDAFAARRRAFVVSSVLLVAAILGLALATRIAIGRFAPTHATLVFEVRPQGDVYVDGALKGKSPPLTQIQLAAGRHTILIRRPLLKPLVQEVELEPGETLVIRHVFTQPPAAKPQQPQKPAWRRFLDRFSK
jgi:hypothetical protein